MSAFGGNMMTAGIRLSARDETAGPLSSARRGFESFRTLVSRPLNVSLRIAGGTMGLLRDINLGLRPVIAGLDRLIDRGAGLEATQKAFGRFAGVADKDAGRLARSLQQSALWTVRWGEAMQIANRAMTTNIPIQEMDTLFAFAARRASATGETVQGVLSGLVSGLGIGSARALKQFGLDIEHVAENYDRIHGSGAFDELPFAARQSKILAAATGEMRKEMALLKIDGNETYFGWQRIKTTIADSVDKLTLAVARSKGMRDFVGGIRDGLAGIASHFEGGGSIKELFFGKGQSGGVFGLLKAGMLDAGEALGRGMLGGMLKAIAGLGQLIAPPAGASGGLSVAGGAVNRLLGGRLTGWLTGDRLGQIEQLRGTGPSDEIAEFLFGRWMDLQEITATAREHGWLSLLGLGKGGGTPLAARARTGSPASGDWKAVMGLREQPIGIREALREIDSDIWNAMGKVPILGRVIRGLAAIPDPPGARPRYAPGLPPMRGVGFGMGFGVGGAEMPTNLHGWAELLGQYGDVILSGGGSSRFMAELDKFFKEYAPEEAPSTEDILGGPREFRLSARARRSMMNQARTLEGRLSNIRRGGEFVRQNALKEAGDYIRKKRREGAIITPEEEREIRAEILQRRTEGALKKPSGDLAGLQAKLSADDDRWGKYTSEQLIRRRLRSAGESDRREGMADEIVKATSNMAQSAARMETNIERLVAAASGVISAMSGATAELAKARS